MTGTDHERFEQWDAAYVLGALSRTDRATFEAHLETCTSCQHAVGELAPMPGLLARTPPAADPAVSPEMPSLPAGLIEGVRRKDRRRVRRRRSLLAVAAAVVVVAVAIPALVLIRAPDDAMLVALEPTAALSTPMTADVAFESSPWGTRLTITCDYPLDTRYGGRESRYALVVTDGNGSESQVSTWRAVSGETVTVEGSTAVDIADMASVAVVGQRGDVVLTSTIPEGR